MDKLNKPFLPQSKKNKVVVALFLIILILFILM